MNIHPNVRLDRARAVLKRLLAVFRPGPEPPDEGRDPYAGRPVPRRPPPGHRSGAVAVAEPDE
jgi:hypothetical protein